ncbi:hypothetical protein Tco_1463130 [Tanacetum coccineum]
MMRINMKNPPLDQTGGPKEEEREKNQSQRVHQRKSPPRQLESLLKGLNLITRISNGLKIWSLTQCGVKFQLATTNMHSGESHIGDENDNNSMDLLLTDWIIVHRDDDKLYTFKEGDFNRLRIEYIEDMLLLLVQGKLTNLTIEEHLDFNVSL